MALKKYCNMGKRNAAHSSWLVSLLHIPLYIQVLLGFTTAGTLGSRSTICTEREIPIPIRQTCTNPMLERTTWKHGLRVLNLFTGIPLQGCGWR